MKLQLIYVTLWSLSQAAYISRMATINRLRSPTAFRPGVMLNRHWTHPRLMQAASHRAPYVLYRSPTNPHSYSRYAMKHFMPGATRNLFSGQWKTTARLPHLTSVTPEYEFVRAASGNPLHTDGGTGAIHTIPAPNLSLSEKPIVVMEGDSLSTNTASSEAPKPTYEVTEKYLDPNAIYQMGKINAPIGFSKATTLTGSEYQALLREGTAALQVASEYGLPAIAVPQQPALLPQPQALQSQQHALQSQQHVLLPQQHALLPQQHALLPQQFTIQGFNGVPSQNDLLHAGADGIVIPPNALYQSDPNFLQKLQAQLMQRFPSVEFIPYATEIHSQVATHPIQFPNQPQIQNQQLQPQVHQNHLQLLQNEQLLQTLAPIQQNQAQASEQALVQTQLQFQPQIQPPAQFQQQIQTKEQPPQPQSQQYFYLETDKIVKQAPASFTQDESQKNVVQRETQESSLATLNPQQIVQNVTESLLEITSASQPQNVTLRLVTEPQPLTTTLKYIAEPNAIPEDQKVAPIYYAQIGQSVGNLIANGFYSAINDVRAAAAVSQVDKPQETTPAHILAENITSTTLNPDIKAYFVPNDEKLNNNQSLVELKPLLGVPFAKKGDSVNLAYTLVRSDGQDPKISKDGSVYAGQLVEASISEDQDFNKEKATLLLKHPPLRLVTGPENKEATTTPSATAVPQIAPSLPKIATVKAKIPPRSKLTFDDRTGEPVLRIYASYIDSPTQKDLIGSKLGAVKTGKGFVSRKQETADKWKSGAVKALDKIQGFDPSQVTSFGLKLRSRSDDYMPLFQEYED